MGRVPLTGAASCVPRALDKSSFFRWAYAGLCFRGSCLPLSVCMLTLFYAAAGHKQPLQPPPAFSMLALRMRVLSAAQGQPFLLGDQGGRTLPETTNFNPFLRAHVCSRVKTSPNAGASRSQVLLGPASTLAHTPSCLPHLLANSTS